jgi:hypothetical protein
MAAVAAILVTGGQVGGGGELERHDQRFPRWIGASAGLPHFYFHHIGGHKPNLGRDQSVPVDEFLVQLHAHQHRQARLARSAIAYEKQSLSSIG